MIRFVCAFVILFSFFATFQAKAQLPSNPWDTKPVKVSEKVEQKIQEPKELPADPWAERRAKNAQRQNSNNATSKNR